MYSKPYSIFIKNNEDEAKSAIKSHEYDTDMQTAIKVPLIILQCFGYFPLQGVSNPDYESLKFSWKSFRTSYAIITLIINAITVLSAVHKFLFRKAALLELSIVIFNSCGFLASILFLRLTKEWPGLMKEWRKVELDVGNVLMQRKLRQKLNLITVIFLTAALIEHSLGKAHDLVHVFGCTKTAADGIRHFIVNISDPHIFSFVEYSWWKGVILQVSIIQKTFSWTFVDVFIILLSVAFTFRLQQLRRKIENLIQTDVLNRSRWKVLREEHESLCRLLTHLNADIAFLVLLSYFTNLYFILLQLFNSFQPIGGTFDKLYFYASFLFLIVRLVSTCLFGSFVNEESKKFLPALLLIRQVNPDIRRLVDQAKTPLVITGKKFFNITRGLILKIAASLVTYELVMMEFTERLEPIDDQESVRHNNSYWLC